MNQVHTSKKTDAGLSKFFMRVYGYMMGAVLISALTSFFINANQLAVIQYIQQRPGTLWMLWIVQIILVFVLAGKGMNNPTLAIGGFIVYSLLMGISLGITLLFYTNATIVAAFLSSAATFGTMAIYGSVTKKDLNVWSSAIFGSLMGIIVAMLLNVFLLKSSAVSLLISILMVIVFAALTAYDHQKMKMYYYQFEGQASLNGIAVFCALQLYLDFINLFLAFLRIFGDNK